MDPSYNALNFLKTTFENTFRLLSQDEEAESNIPPPKSLCFSIPARGISEAKKNIYSSLGQQHRSNLTDILSLSEKPKIMILDPTLIGPMGRMIPVAELKQKGVKVFYSMNDVSLKYQNHHFIYIVRSSVKNGHDLYQLFAKNLPQLVQDNLHTVFTVPRSSLTFQIKLHENDLQNKISCIEKYALNIFPMTDDLLSLESKDSLNTIVNDCDQTPLLNLAEAIFQLEQVYGQIRNINFAGQHSEKVVELLKRRRLETPLENKETSFARLTLIDRVEDLITPCLIPSTYEALIDEFYGITNNAITLEDKTSVSLESDNDFYIQLKDTHISHIKQIIHNELEKIKKAEEDAKNLLHNPMTTPADLSKIPQKIKELSDRKNRCKNHIQIAQTLVDKFKDQIFQLILQEEQNILTETNPKGSIEFIDELIDRNQPIQQVLRLLFLYTQVYGNLEPKTNEAIYTGILQTYGYQQLLTLKNYEEFLKFRKTDFSKVRDTNHLISQFDPSSPKDISFAYNGYAPLSCRLLQHHLSKPLEFPSDGLELVCFVGGCTRAELSACRLISDKIVVLTSNTINGLSFVTSMSGVSG